MRTACSIICADVPQYSARPFKLAPSQKRLRDSLRLVVDWSSCRSWPSLPTVGHRLPFRTEEDEFGAMGIEDFAAIGSEDHTQDSDAPIRGIFSIWRGRDESDDAVPKTAGSNRQDQAALVPRTVASPSSEHRSTQRRPAFSASLGCDREWHHRSISTTPLEITVSHGRVEVA